MANIKLGRLWPFLAFLLFFIYPVQAAEANVMDRIKDIYNAPDKVDELRRQYDETAKLLDLQQQQLESANNAMEKYAEEQQLLMDENSRLDRQNDRLTEQNALLTQRLEQLEKDKADKNQLYRKWMAAMISAIAIVAGYLLSIRIWRYAVWRKQRQLGGGV